MSGKDNRNYEIGYRKPPRATQFKPGQSGNTKGRSKGSKNLATALEDELKERVTVTENGRRRTISKGEALVKQTVNKAVSGDTKATQMVLNERRPHENLPSDAPSQEILASPEDKLVAESIVRRILQAHSAEAGTPKPVEPSAEPTPGELTSNRGG